MTSLKKNIFKNGIASLVQKLIRVLEQLFLIPFFITAWGAAYYGEWLTLTIIPNVLALANMGFGSAASNSFVLEYVAGRYQKAADIQKNGIYIITLAVSAALVLSFLILFLLDYYHVFDKTLISKNNAIIAVSILMLSRLITFYTQFFDGYYRAARKAALGISLINVRSFSSILSGLLVLLCGYDIVIFAVSQLVVNLLFNLYFGYKGKKVLGWSSEYIGVKDINVIRNIARKGLGYLLTTAWQAIFFQGTTLAIRMVLGPTSVAIFNTVRALTRSVNQLYTMVNVSIFPELQYEIGSGNFSKARKLFRVSFYFTIFAALIGSSILAIFGLWFYGVWTNNLVEVPLLLWYAFVVGVLFNALWWTAGVIFKAINEPKVFAIFGITSALISVIATFFLCKYMGLNGAAIGALVLEVLMVILVLPSACKLLDMSVRDLFFRGFKDFVNTAQKIFSK